MSGVGRVFVSHASADLAWAEWVAWQLQDAGYEVELAVWHWGAGDNVIQNMDKALASGPMVALFSAAYFEPERWTTEEWTARLAGREGLIPVRIEDCAAPSMLRALLAPALFGLGEEKAREVLLAAVAGPAGAPRVSPRFPDQAGAGRLRSVGATGPRLPGTLPRVWNVPARNAGFVGRNDLLTEVRSRLAGGRTVAVVALDGRGGVGKTQLAAEYAHRFCGEYELVWWVRAEDPALISEQLALLAVETGAAQSKVPPEKAVQALGHELRSRARWLLIFDNAEDPEALADFVPSGPGHVLITSRNPDWHGMASPLDVDVLARQESIDLLRSRTPWLSEAEAGRLAEALDDLPLALVQAAAVLTTTTVDDYLVLLTSNASEVTDEGRPRDYRWSLAAQIRLSMQRLRSLNAEAADVMNACALLAPEPFVLPAGAGLTSDEDAIWRVVADRRTRTRVLSALHQHGLARVAGGSLHLHRLTLAVLKDQLTPEEHVAAAENASALLAAAYPGKAQEPASWPRWPDLLPHLLAIDPTDLVSAEARFAACEACLYLLDRGSAAAILPRLKDLYHAWNALLGPDHTHTEWAANYLAMAFSAVGDHDSAYALHRDMFDRQRRVSGEDHPDTLATASNLAIRLAGLGRVEEAFELGEDTFARRGRVLGEDHPDTLRTGSNVANWLGQLGRVEEAVELGEDALARLRRVLGEDHPGTLATASNLAIWRGELGRAEEAVELGEDTLARRRRVLGEDHPDTLRTASNLAIWRGELGRAEGAVELGEDTLARRRRVLGEDHPDTLVTASNLASRLGELGRVEEAVELGEDALARLRRVSGEDHPATLATASNLAVDLGGAGRVEEAVELGEDTLARRRRVLGEDHPDTLATASNLAIRLGGLGRVEEAGELGEDTLARRRRVLGEDHPDTLVTARWLSTLLRRK
ncbi:FxSxx-COOH system tetratricopeptide repeat protein [Streptomyces sp. FB2]|uniref:FxSxx-COOH system tetratricopeptide repeat protein n=1 Tax=Streptomyces sp. FB2 TaxID=2902454 RepID=UPI001F251961|nr:FxSxx-COOH system tetratricopeptide repeat protein [Streptomyces sp. FB2]MCF2540784.1 FxSxx-COOH system tetratricopeptide repeat protein [Streptomyces sp. FB2]